MSPPLGIAEGGGSKVSLVASSASTDSTCQNGPGLTERNYMSLSDCSSVESNVVVTCLSEEKNTSLNLKATELRLGLPGSQSPVRDPELSLLSSKKLDEKPLFPLHPSKDGSFSTVPKNVSSGNKRGFSDAMDGFSETKTSVFTETNWMFPTAVSDLEVSQSLAQVKFPGNQVVNSVLSSRALPNSGAKTVPLKEQSGSSSQILKETLPSKLPQDKPRNPNDGNHNQMGSANNNGNAPAAKLSVEHNRKVINDLSIHHRAQVVGWPPIRSFRKNTLATTSKNNDEVDGKPGSGALFVKVSMDGAPYLRKVDLKTYSTYLELSSALEKMFSCFTIGQYGSHGVPGRDMLSESKLKDLLHGSEYVLTYEDKDGDWMLVGDVPWEMFIDSCKRMRIMKSSDAIGLAPRAMEKSRNRN